MTLGTQQDLCDNVEVWDGEGDGREGGREHGCTYD